VRRHASEKIISILQLMDRLPENERLTVDVLRQIIIQNLPSQCKEKLAFNVPFFYGKRGICIVWPSTIPGGGIKQGVLLGFWQGRRLNDGDGFLVRSTNKKIFYRIFKNVDEIDDAPIVKLLKEAVRIDNLLPDKTSFRKNK